MSADRRYPEVMVAPGDGGASELLILSRATIPPWWSRPGVSPPRDCPAAERQLRAVMESLGHLAAWAYHGRSILISTGSGVNPLPTPLARAAAAPLQAWLRHHAEFGCSACAPELQEQEQEE